MLRKLFTYLWVLSIVMILFSGCNSQISYNFKQDRQNISEISLIYIDKNDKNNITVFEILSETKNAQFVEAFCEIACYRRISNPSEPGSAMGLAICFTYADGMYEVVTAEHVDVYSHTGNVLYRKPSEDLYFDDAEFEGLIEAYFANIPSSIS